MLNARDRRLKDALLRTVDDSGAETLRRYFAQLQYTAAYCVRMLRADSDIEAVVPEVGEDLVIERSDRDELRQVKTRTESVGAWRLPDLLAVLCKQYALRGHFRPGCTFHFVSDRAADPRSRPRGLDCGPLYRLKDVLARSAEGTMTPDEAIELAAFEEALCPEIVRRMAEHGETLTDADALDLLRRTRIETEEPRLREFNWPGDLQRALEDARPGVEYRFRELVAIWEAVVTLVIDRVVNGTSPAGRRLVRADVEGCLQAWGAGPDAAWDAPGATVLERKCLAGGFDTVRVRNFARQRVLAEVALRRLEALGLRQEVDLLAADLSERQAVCLERSADEDAPGPHTLALVKGEVASAVARALGSRVSDDRRQALGEGLLWRETEACYIRWDVPSRAA